MVENSMPIQLREIEKARVFAGRLLDESDSEYGLYSCALSKWINVLNISSEQGRKLISMASRDTSSFVSILKSWVEYLSSEISCKNPGFQVVPVVVIDPIQRFGETTGKGEVESLNKLSSELRNATISGDFPWVTLVTSDTNKESSTGRVKNRDIRAEGTAAFRGSYNLLHEVSVALYMRKPPGSDWAENEATSVRQVEVGVVKNRYGRAPFGTSKDPHPRFEYDAKCGRFLPYSIDSAQYMRKRDEEHLEAIKRANGGSTGGGGQENNPPIESPTPNPGVIVH